MITYREWILKQKLPIAVERLHLSVAIRRGWLNDLVEDIGGIAAVVVK